jgi:uncharacterized protein YdaU (DUF1376 family)
MPARDRRRPFWSKWCWKDWDAKTKDLTPYEYTAYHRLLSYAATCSADLCSIPNDNGRLCRAVGFGTKRWLAVRQRVLDFFLLRGDGRYESPRLREDADRWAQVVALQTERVNRRYPEVATGGTTEGQPRARKSQKSEVRSQIEVIEATHLPTNVGVVGLGNGEDKTDHRAEWDEAFHESFWPEYPRKVKKPPALRAWRALRPWTQEHLDSIYGGLEHWVTYWKDRATPLDKIPYPATFLNGHQHEDNPQ